MLCTTVLSKKAIAGIVLLHLPDMLYVSLQW